MSQDTDSKPLRCDSFTGLPGPLEDEGAVISCSGLKRFAFLSYYSCLLIACSHNSIWHLIEMEEDEQPMLQSPSCLEGYLKPHSHFKPSCTHFTQQKFNTDSMMGIWSLRSLCWWGDSGKYEAPVTAFVDRGTFEYLLPLSRVGLSPPVAMPTGEVSWICISIPCPPSPFPCVQRYDLLCGGVGLGEKMEMQFLGAQLGSRSAELPL